MQPTQYGYVAHFTYRARICRAAASRSSSARSRTGASSTKNVLKIGSKTMDAGKDGEWIETFYNGDPLYGFQVYFADGSSATWTVKTAT